MDPLDPKAVRLSCAQAAALLRVPVRTLERWRLQGLGPLHFKPKGMRCFYLESDVRDWMNAGRGGNISCNPSKPRASSA